MRRALGFGVLCLLGSPWVLWELATRPLRRRRPVEPPRPSAADAGCPGCGEDMGGAPHFHEGRAYFPTADPGIVIEQAQAERERPR